MAGWAVEGGQPALACCRGSSKGSSSVAPEFSACSAGEGYGMVVASSESDTGFRRLFVLALRRRAEGTVPLAPLDASGPGVVAKASAGGAGGVDGVRRGADGCRGATRGMPVAGGGPPSNADTSGGGTDFVAFWPSTRAFRTKGPTTTSSTARISQAVTWCPLTYSPPAEPESWTAALPFWK